VPAHPGLTRRSRPRCHLLAGAAGSARHRSLDSFSIFLACGLTATWSGLTFFLSSGSFDSSSQSPACSARACIEAACSPACEEPIRYLRRAAELCSLLPAPVQGLSPQCMAYVMVRGQHATARFRMHYERLVVCSQEVSGPHQMHRRTMMHALVSPAATGHRAAAAPPTVGGLWRASTTHRLHCNPGDCRAACRRTSALRLHCKWCAFTALAGAPQQRVRRAQPAAVCAGAAGCGLPGSRGKRLLLPAAGEICWCLKTRARSLCGCSPVLSLLF